jgi:hypothetical protein
MVLCVRAAHDNSPEPFEVLYGLSWHIAAPQTGLATLVRRLDLAKLWLLTPNTKCSAARNWKEMRGFADQRRNARIIAP